MLILTSSKKTTWRVGAALLLAGGLSLPLVGCSSGTIPSCSEYAELSSEGLTVELNDDQRSALKSALKSRDFDATLTNVEVAGAQVQYFCQIAFGTANANASASIADGLS